MLNGVLVPHQDSEPSHATRETPIAVQPLRRVKVACRLMFARLLQELHRGV